MDDKTAIAKQNEVKAQIAAQISQGLEYECGDCAKIVKLRPRDQVLCHDCGHRILYKPRTKRVQQYEAR